MPNSVAISDSRFLLRLPEALVYTGLGRSNFLSKVKAGELPASVRLGPRAVAWRKDELDQWIASLPRATPRSKGKKAAA